MSRLFLLNVLLLAGIAMATLKLLELRDETARREEMVRESAPKLPQAKGTTAVAPPERTVAANYLDIASRLLFSKDRNPTVIIAPPPVKQVPAFPLAYGVLMMADPPIIMMAAKKGDGQKGYRAGDQIGDYKIVGFDSRVITFEWDGQKFTKNVAELADRDAQTAALMNRQNVQNTPEPAAAAPVASTQVLSSSGSTAAKGPGVDTGGGIRACAAGDTAAPGTVTDGYRKIVSETPFGKVCRWEQVK
ncbi:MAG: hypothetical protein JNM66_20090 [Bryobacterales bacterium]|nr:hypothetical protein [Bryobacterales bacterium]